jgi:hypothetical protein
VVAVRLLFALWGFFIGGNMNYSELLKSPKWQKKRLEIMNRDGWKCKDCGDENKQLQVHHIKYEHGKLPWEYEDNNFETLCNECHQIKHFPPIKATLSKGTIHPKDVVKTFPFFNNVFSEITNHKGCWNLTLRPNVIKNFGPSMNHKKHNYFRCLAYLMGYAWFDQPFVVFNEKGIEILEVNPNDWIYKEIEINYKHEMQEAEELYYLDNPDHLKTDKP